VMPRKIALLCTFSTVPRTLRMAQLLTDAGNTVHIIEWDRTGLKPRAELKMEFLQKTWNKIGFGPECYLPYAYLVLLSFFHCLSRTTT